MALVRFGASAFDPDDLSAVARQGAGWFRPGVARFKIVVRGGTALDLAGADAEALALFVGALPAFEPPCPAQTSVSRPGYPRAAKGEQGG